MATEEQLIADRRNAQLSRAARTGEGSSVSGVQLAETERAPDQNGFVSPNHEIVPALHYVACPAIIDRPGFQWRGPVSRVGSRPKKRKGRCLAPPYNEETFPNGGANATRLARVPQKKKRSASPHYN